MVRDSQNGFQNNKLSLNLKSQQITEHALSKDEYFGQLQSFLQHTIHPVWPLLITNNLAIEPIAEMMFKCI